jgi:hypothetical protein
VHYHMLAIEGVYRESVPGGSPEFVSAPPPTEEDVADLAARLARRIQRVLERRHAGSEEPGESDPVRESEPGLAGLYAASILNRVAAGQRRRQRVPQNGDRVDPEGLDNSGLRRCATVEGFSVHADVAVPARDRQRRERLARYMARPPLCEDNLDVLACPSCPGRLHLIALIHPPDTTRKILECLGLPSRPPPPAPARRSQSHSGF